MPTLSPEQSVPAFRQSRETKWYEIVSEAPDFGKKAPASMKFRISASSSAAARISLSVTILDYSLTHKGIPP
jgi:hypothetical protein